MTLPGKSVSEDGEPMSWGPQQIKQGMDQSEDWVATGAKRRRMQQQQGEQQQRRKLQEDYAGREEGEADDEDKSATLLSKKGGCSNPSSKKGESPMLLLSNEVEVNGGVPEQKTFVVDAALGETEGQPFPATATATKEAREEDKGCSDAATTETTTET
mmetsp:Transcript_52616/g.112223  ORF Transcript_52616/g.112223 Transcript_52616/m.112223 type:complete len:158 (-) Transcript_52616:240-713(-)